MKTIPCRLTLLLALALSATIGLVAYGNQSSTNNTTQGDPKTAIKAPTEAAAPRLEVTANPSDPRTAELRDKDAALPGQGKNIAIDLGGGVTMQFVLIRPGSFQMGSKPGFPDEMPVHKVTITKPFYLGKYKVTQEQWQKVMGSNPSDFKGPKLPVEQVSWNDCQNFLAKLKKKVTGYEFRLPTEAQWEYACRAGSTGDYCFDDGETNVGEYGWHSNNSGGKTHPVGEKKPNAWGLYDMHGNVWEWCSDAYGPYSSEAVIDPKGANSGNRVLRGGAWYINPRCLRSASRDNGMPDYRYNGIGLRCVAVSGSAR